MDAKEFLEKSNIYKLGSLTTERPNKKSINLSQYAQNDVLKAIAISKEIDSDALGTLICYREKVEGIARSIRSVKQSGGRVFLCGCGATGRLSLTLEFLWRERHPDSEFVQAFMAGGDIALVHSLEGFEDYPEYGERHARQLGFTENDLLIGITEGGETPYVIGATEFGSQVSKHGAVFVYCNPDEELQKVERSRRVLENSKIDSYCLETGSMTLAGSTRMQASTVLQLAVGMALFDDDISFDDLATFKKFFDTTDLSPMKGFIDSESAIYQRGDYLLYAPYDYAITTFTDTTERSPTFSLPPFENPSAPTDRLPSLCYIKIPDVHEASQSWHNLLLRKPIPLKWDEVDPRTGEEYLDQFDFSENISSLRQRRLGQAQQVEFSIRKVEGPAIQLKLQDLSWNIAISNFSPLFQHTLLKMILNTHSTLLMGTLKRYHSNIMTWVSPTNGKLIDRSARNIRYLLEQDGISIEYSKVVESLFQKLKNNDLDSPVVVRTYECLKERMNHDIS